MIILVDVINLDSRIVYTCSPTAVCGCSATSASITRIVGGQTATANSWSWTVSVSWNGNFICGGSIVSSSYIFLRQHIVPHLSKHHK